MSGPKNATDAHMLMPPKKGVRVKKIMQSIAGPARMANWRIVMEKTQSPISLRSVLSASSILWFSDIGLSVLYPQIAQLMTP